MTNVTKPVPRSRRIRANSRRLPGLFVLAVTTVLWQTGALTSGISLLRPHDFAEPCVGTLDGSQFPELVPDSHAWNGLWTTVSTASSIQLVKKALDVDAAALAGVQAAAAKSLAKTGLLQRGGSPASVAMPSRLPVSPESETQAALADVSLDSRDELIKTLTRAQFKKVSDWVNAQRRRTTYDFGPIGVLANPDSTGARKCRVSVHGAKRPDLIPESYYWEAYFRFKAAAARRHLVDVDTFSNEYLVVQQQHHLPMPTSDIQLLLSTASRAIHEVDLLRESFKGTTESERADLRYRAAETIQERRADLLRSLPESTWLSVQRDANHTRASTIYDFPPVLDGGR